MTVTTTTTTNTYTGDGSTTAFSFTFEILETTDIKVIVVTTATGAESVRSIGTGSTNYAVTGTGNVNGGTVTFVTAPTASETVFLMRNMSFTQPTNYRVNDPFPAETHENALDRMALQIQQIGRRLDRALLRPESDTTSGTLPVNATLKGKFLKFNSSTGVPETDTVKGFTGGSYASGTGIITFTSDDGLGFATSDLRGASTTATSSANGLMSSSDKSKLDAIEASATADQTASEILTLIKTVDGGSSGLDSDLLDGQEGSHYLDAGNLTGTVANARLDAQLQDVAGLAVTDSGFIVGDGSNFVLETGATVRTSLGLGTAATLDTGISNTNVPKFTSGVADDDFLRVNGTAIEGRSASEVLSDIGGQASLTFGISNTNAVKIDSSSVADDEFARFTSSGLESRSASEVLSDIGGQASLTFGISNTNAVKIDSSSVADDEYARFTANGLESRSTSEVLSDIAAMPLAGGTFSNDVTFSDDVKAIFGTGSDLEIYHDGSGSIIHDNGTGALLVRTNNFKVNNAGNSEKILHGVENGAVELYHDNSKKLETTSSGATVTGTLVADGLTMGDSESITLGDGSDFTILHSGSASIIRETGAAELFLQDNQSIKITKVNATETMAVFVPDGAVELYHDDSKKLETTSDGASITGDLTLTSTDAGATENPTLDLYRNSASPADSDVLGHIDFSGENSAGEKIVYAQINADAADVTDGTEDGRMDISVMSGGSESQRLIFQGNGVTRFVNNDVEIGIGLSLRFEGATDDTNETTLTVTDPTSDNTITLPDATGTVALQEQAYQAINAQTGTTYTTVLADGGKLVTLSNGSAITLTIPPNSSVAYPIGTKLDFIQIGAGQVTVAGGSGVTVNSTPTLKFRAQHSGASCIKIATDTWQLVGDLASS
jgi:hypothetical protein